MIHRYGWVRDTPHHEDADYAFKLVRGVKLPASVAQLTKGFPVFDQGALGSCVANGCAALWQHRHIVEKLSANPASRLFIYYNGRVLEGTVNQDSGLMVRDGLKVLAKQGACFEKTWPYVVSKFKQKPSTGAYSEAVKELALQYSSVANNLMAIKQALAAGNPVTFGFTVYESFESDTVARTGIMPMPKKGEKALGGHCVVADGYDDKTQTFWVRNSWGTGWGLQGWFKMPYANLVNSSDFWILTKVE